MKEKVKSSVDRRREEGDDLSSLRLLSSIDEVGGEDNNGGGGNDHSLPSLSETIIITDKTTSSPPQLDEPPSPPGVKDTESTQSIPDLSMHCDSDVDSDDSDERIKHRSAIETQGSHSRDHRDTPSDEEPYFEELKMCRGSLTALFNHSNPPGIQNTDDGRVYDDEELSSGFGLLKYAESSSSNQGSPTHTFKTALNLYKFKKIHDDIVDKDRAGQDDVVDGTEYNRCSGQGVKDETVVVESDNTLTDINDYILAQANNDLDSTMKLLEGANIQGTIDKNLSVIQCILDDLHGNGDRDMIGPLKNLSGIDIELSDNLKSESAESVRNEGVREIDPLLSQFCKQYTSTPKQFPTPAPASHNNDEVYRAVKVFSNTQESYNPITHQPTPAPLFQPTPTPLSQSTPQPTSVPLSQPILGQLKQLGLVGGPTVNPTTPHRSVEGASGGSNVITCLVYVVNGPLLSNGLPGPKCHLFIPNTRPSVAIPVNVLQGFCLPADIPHSTNPLCFYMLHNNPASIVLLPPNFNTISNILPLFKHEFKMGCQCSTNHSFNKTYSQSAGQHVSRDSQCGSRYRMRLSDWIPQYPPVDEVPVNEVSPPGPGMSECLPSTSYTLQSPWNTYVHKQQPPLSVPWWKLRQPPSGSDTSCCCDIFSIQIGDWMFKADADMGGHARLKIVANERLLQYELQYRGVGVDSNYENHSTIDISFSSITGLSMSGREMNISVNEVSCFYTHSQHLSDISLSYNCADDFTGGNLSSADCHLVKFTGACLFKIRYYLLLSDQELFQPMLLHQSSPRNDNKKKHSSKKKSSSTSTKKPEKSDPIPPKDDIMPVSKKRKLTNSTPVTADNIVSNAKIGRRTHNKKLCRVQRLNPCTCACNAGCTTMRCKCMRDKVLCRTCQCTDCENPYNTLIDKGFNLFNILTDICLLDNAHRLTVTMTMALHYTCEQTLCCGTVLTVKDILRGVTRCRCGICQFQFSWCQMKFYSTTIDMFMVKHCSLCHRCVSTTSVHCQKCCKCYTPKEGYTSCRCQDQVPVIATSCCRKSISPSCSDKQNNKMEDGEVN